MAMGFLNCMSVFESKISAWLVDWNTEWLLCFCTLHSAIVWNVWNVLENIGTFDSFV